MNRNRRAPSPRKLSKKRKSRKTPTANKAELTTNSSKKDWHQGAEDLEEEEWTEAYLRAQMKETRFSMKLDLSNKCLDRIPQSTFSISPPRHPNLLAAIEILDLSQNMLTTLPSDISGLKQVRVLILTDNSLRSIPESIMSLDRLDYLEIKRNKLNNRQKELKLNVPPKLKILDLEDNCSLHLLPEGFQKLEEITELRLSYCCIETLPDCIGNLSTLKRIHLAGNKLRTLPESFGRLHNLETLDLEGNRRLSTLPLSLHRLRKLKEKERGANTGLVLNNTPALQLPSRKIVKEGTVSILIELLAEDCIHNAQFDIVDDVIDETVIEILSEDAVAIAEKSVCDEIMLEIIEDAVVEQGCLEDIVHSMFEDVILVLVNETVDEELLLPTLDDMLEETVTLMTKEVTENAVEEDTMAWEVMEELLAEITTAMTKKEASDTMICQAVDCLLTEIFKEIALEEDKE